MILINELVFLPEGRAVSGLKGECFEKAFFGLDCND